MKLNPKIAEAVGLWLAEGDSKTISEITFTNNCLELVLFFNYIKTKNGVYWGKTRIIERFLLEKKLEILVKFNKLKTINKLSSELNVSPKSIRKLFKEYNQENLIKKENGRWKILRKGESLISGVDESGSEIQK